MTAVERDRRRRAFGPGGGHAATAPPPSTVPPGAPASLSATAGNGQVSLSWSPPPSNGGPPVSSYNVYLSTTPGPRGPRSRVTATSYTATGLQDGTTYYFEVTAVNSAGEGTASVQVAVHSGPAGYRVAGSNGQVFALGKLRLAPFPAPGVAGRGVASTPDGRGYWLVLENGGVL